MKITTNTTNRRTIDTHNMPMHGLRKAVSAIRCWGEYDRAAEQVNYDRRTGEIWTDTVIGDSWEEYHDSQIINVGAYCGRVTMQQLADGIAHAVDMADQRAVWGY